EAGWLLGRPAPRDADEAEEAARELLAKGFRSVVVKGGHLSGAPVDVVAWKDGSRRLRRRERSPSSLRGTGCRFGAFLATRLAQGLKVDQAAEAAHLYLGQLLRAERTPTVASRGVSRGRSGQ